jgi:hypothetical protein
VLLNFRSRVDLLGGCSAQIFSLLGLRLLANVSGCVESDGDDGGVEGAMEACLLAPSDNGVEHFLSCSAEVGEPCNFVDSSAGILSTSDSSPPVDC